MMETLKLRHASDQAYKKYLHPLLEPLNKDRLKDNISHFVLRLAYCRTEDLRRWFLMQEVELLKYRLNNNRSAVTTSSSSSSSSSSSNGTTTSPVSTALKSILPDIQTLDRKQMEKMWPLIYNATPGLSQTQIPKIYLVPFTQALDLVQRRQVYVKAGTAYVPETKLVQLVTERFRANLSRQLVLLNTVPATPELERSSTFLKNVSTVQTVDTSSFLSDGDESGSNLNANTVKAHLKHMPLCMAQLQLGLQQDHHLKHWGRLQYGLFLKGAGLSLEDAMMYFERMFTLKGFTKAYQYSVRHMYGREGARKNYPPYSCTKIINSNAPNVNDHHGCPYKHSSVLQVSNMLSRLGISDQKEILAEQESHHYQLACMKHFKIVHPELHAFRDSSLDHVGNHPNAWFKASVEYTKSFHPGGGKEGSAGTTSTTTVEGTGHDKKATANNQSSNVAVSP